MAGLYRHAFILQTPLQTTLQQFYRAVKCSVKAEHATHFTGFTDFRVTPLDGLSVLHLVERLGVGVPILARQ